MTSVIPKDIFYIDDVSAKAGASLKDAVLATLNVLPTQFKPFSQWSYKEGFWLSCGWAGNAEFIMMIKKVSVTHVWGIVQMYSDLYTVSYNFTTNTLGFYKATMTAQ